MTQVNPYLFFGGQAQAALDFYCQAVGAETRDILRFGANADSPDCPNQVPDGWSEKVMHSALRIGSQEIYLSDGMSEGTNFDAVMLALTCESAEDLHAKFTALAEGGSVQMPPGPTFFSPLYAMLRDRFGLGWMLMLPPEGPTKSRIRKTIDIAAPPERIWETLTTPTGFADWGAAFMPGSIFEGTYAQGEKLRFLAPDRQEGMVAIVEELDAPFRVQLRHHAVISGGVECQEGPGYDLWIPATEVYTLTPNGSGTTLAIENDLPTNMLDMFCTSWTDALSRIKARAERP